MFCNFLWLLYARRAHHLNDATYNDKRKQKCDYRLFFSSEKTWHCKEKKSGRTVSELARLFRQREAYSVRVSICIVLPSAGVSTRKK